LPDLIAFLPGGKVFLHSSHPPHWCCTNGCVATPDIPLLSYSG